MHGDTALHLACEYGFFALVLLLIDKGSSLEIENNVSLRAIQSAQAKC
jgi:ankyrin repeat protein